LISQYFFFWAGGCNVLSPFETSEVERREEEKLAKEARTSLRNEEGNEEASRRSS
jgi:hypothetical protein